MHEQLATRHTGRDRHCNLTLSCTVDPEPLLAGPTRNGLGQERLAGIGDAGLAGVMGPQRGSILGGGGIKRSRIKDIQRRPVLRSQFRQEAAPNRQRSAAVMRRCRRRRREKGQAPLGQDRHDVRQPRS